MRYLFASIFFLLITSCDNLGLVRSNYNESDTVFFDSLSLELANPLILELDSTTSPVSFNIQHIEIEGQEFLAYWNKTDRKAVFFDLSIGKAIRKLQFLNSGPNKILSSNFYFHNDDSVFSTDTMLAFYLSNMKAELIQKYPIGDESKIDMVPGPYVWTQSPLIFDNENLYFQGYIGGLYTQPNMVKLNLNDSTVDYFSGFPDFYQEAYWRGGFEYMSFTYNGEKRLLVLSYTADHSLVVIPLEDLEKEDRYYAGSSEFGELKPPREKMKDPGGEQDERKFLLQPSFGAVLYDKYRKLYYRFGYDAIAETDLGSNDAKRSKIKKPRIIILNSNFKKVGEVELPRFKYDLQMVFVSKKGLQIKVNNYENEDILEFDTFKPSPKEGSF